MFNSKGTYYKNFALLFAGNTIGQLAPFLLAPIIGRIFNPQQLAIQENFLAIVSLISIIVAGRYEMALVLPKNIKKANNLLVLSIFITAAISLLSLSAIFVSDQISKWYNDDDLGKYILYLSPSVFLLGISNIFMQWAIRAGKYPFVSLSRIAQSVSQNSGYALMGYIGWGVNGLIIAWLIGNLISIAILLFPSINIFNRSDIDMNEMKSVAVEYKDFPMINSLHAFTGIFAEQFLLFFIITRNYGMFTLGLFAIMNRYMRAPIGLVGSAAGQIFYREATELKNNNIPILPLFIKSTRIVGFIATPMIMIVLFWGPDVFALYLGEAWRNAGTYARIMSPCILFNFICSPVSFTPLIYNRQKSAFLFSIAGYAAGIGPLFFGIIQQYTFETSLLFYYIGMTIYYIALLFWYRHLIKTA